MTAWKCTGLADATVDAVQWRVREYLIIAKTRTIADSPVGVYYYLYVATIIFIEGEEEESSPLTVLLFLCIYLEDLEPIFP